MDAQSELKITWQKAGRNGRFELTAWLGETPLHTDRITLADARARRAFVRRVCDGRKGIDPEELREKLEEIAASTAAGNDAGGTANSASDGPPRYVATEMGLSWLKATQDGDVEIPLTNFGARVVAELMKDDGVETRLFYEIEVKMAGRAFPITVPASRFAGMTWVAQLGARAIVHPGLIIKDRARAAIQALSQEIPRKTVYAHTGWREVDGQWLYLHAGGAIGAGGAVPGIQVALTESLGSYRLPDPPKGHQLKEAIAATLRCVDLAPDPISIPGSIAPFLAALGASDFTLYLEGLTGVLKTAYAALMNQHYGPDNDARHLPASWHGTENALGALAFTAKDALLVIDDFAPAGPRHDVQRLHQKADRVLRDQGNRNCRQRMRVDRSLEPPRPPRGMIVSTGEDVPVGQSLRARIFTIEIRKGDIDLARLSRCQGDAAQGLYAAAMAGFVEWLAGRYERLQNDLPAQIAELRQRAAGTHLRTPEIVARFAVGLKYILDFAREKGAITAQKAEDLRNRGWEALRQAAAKQGDYLRASEPVARFVELLQSAIASGHAHLAGSDGRQPARAPESWGWRQRTIGNGRNEGTEWEPQGDRVGWVDGESVYLDPDASYRAAQSMAAAGTDGLTITAQTLRKRLYERGLLVVASSRETLTIRKVLEGRTRSVLQLVPGTLTCAIPDIPDISDSGGARDGQECQECQVSGGEGRP